MSTLAAAATPRVQYKSNRSTSKPNYSVYKHDLNTTQIRTTMLAIFAAVPSRFGQPDESSHATQHLTDNSKHHVATCFVLFYPQFASHCITDSNRLGDLEIYFSCEQERNHRQGRAFQRVQLPQRQRRESTSDDDSIISRQATALLIKEVAVPVRDHCHFWRRQA